MPILEVVAVSYDEEYNFRERVLELIQEKMDKKHLHLNTHNEQYVVRLTVERVTSPDQSTV